MFCFKQGAKYTDEWPKSSSSVYYVREFAKYTLYITARWDPFRIAQLWLIWQWGPFLFCSATYTLPWCTTCVSQNPVSHFFNNHLKAGAPYYGYFLYDIKLKKEVKAILECVQTPLLYVVEPVSFLVFVYMYAIWGKLNAKVWMQSLAKYVLTSVPTWHYIDNIILCSMDRLSKYIQDKQVTNWDQFHVLNQGLKVSGL